MESKGALRRKNTTKELPLRILSLDGGGVRGYSMLIIIQELMHRTYVEANGEAPRRHQIPKPADHFDLIVGSGTGGMIAIMLGRLRLDIETCKEMYVRTSRKVFETEKRIAGIPYTSTIFKASRLEEAMKECLIEHSMLHVEGNDDTEPLDVARILSNSFKGHRYNNRNSSVVSFSSRGSRLSTNPSLLSMNLKSSETLLYDERKDRTKTAVTAIFKGTPKGGQPALLRSYDSRKEPLVEPDCTIWQAGRATTAILLAFKPIQIGQSVFIDEGAGNFNPAITALEEACINEWPSREVGVFVSIGTGTRPSDSRMDAHQWYDGFMGDFADARQQLISKIEGCEKTHEYIIREGLAKYGVNPENYYRFNVEVGVGEFKINEWTRLADISTSTRRYLAKPQIQRINIKVASKLATINRARLRNRGKLNNSSSIPNSIPEPNPDAVELPADSPINPVTHISGQSNRSHKPDVTVFPKNPSPRYSNSPSPRRHPNKDETPYAIREDLISFDNDTIDLINNKIFPRNGSLPSYRINSPPLPPRLTINRPKDTDRLLPPYPLDDELPPAVDKSRKPNYKRS